MTMLLTNFKCSYLKSEIFLFDYENERLEEVKFWIFKYLGDISQRELNEN